MIVAESLSCKLECYQYPDAIARKPALMQCSQRIRNFGTSCSIAEVQKLYTEDVETDLIKTVASMPIDMQTVMNYWAPARDEAHLLVTKWITSQSPATASPHPSSSQLASSSTGQQMQAATCAADSVAARYCLLPIAYCLLPIAYCLLLIVYCILSIAYCLLPSY